MAVTPVIFARNKVTLNPTVSVHEISAKPMTKEEKSELYITKDDYDMAILEVKAIALKHQQLQVSKEDNSKRSIFTGMVTAEADDFLRGTESRLYPQRFQNRWVARRALLKYQTHLQTNCAGITPEQKSNAMRIASEKLSAWSQLVAQETARLDSLRAYDADYLIPLPLDDAPIQFSSSPYVTLKCRGSVQDLKVGRVTPTSEDVPGSSKNGRAMSCPNPKILPEAPSRPSKKARTAEVQAQADVKKVRTILTEISRLQILRSI